MRTVINIMVLGISFLYQSAWASNDLVLSKISDNVYAIVGQLSNRSAENLGNNATFGFVVTTQGVVLIDSGGTYAGAKKIATLIKTVTNKAVVKVINSGGQDHRWFGNGYFKQQGAEIIASKKAVADHKARFSDQYSRLATLVGDDSLMKGTEAVYAETVFDDALMFKLGDVNFEIYHKGQAHTPGDSYIWLPEQQVMFSGDIVYITRMLGVGSQSNSQSWVKVFESMAQLKPKVIVPGHGAVTTLAQAQKDTYDYLIYLRKLVGQFMDDGGELADISQVDVSQFDYLQNSNTLSGRNAQKVFSELEWE